MQDLEDFKSKLQYINNNRPQKAILEWIQNATEIFKNEPVVMNVKGEAIVCGDIHGDLDSLWEVIQLFFKSNKKYLIFLGDYVDRGSESIHVLILLFYLKCQYPDQIIVLRGNHEYATTKSTSKNEWRQTKLAKILIPVFSHLPLVCIVNEDIMCLHGGLAEADFRNVESKSISNDTIGYQIVWNDFASQDSTETLRGKPFDEVLFQKFLEINQMKMVVRGHQHTQNGFVEYVPNLFTITSSRKLSKQNCSAIAIIEQNTIYPSLF